MKKFYTAGVLMSEIVTVSQQPKEQIQTYVVYLLIEQIY